MTRQNQIVIVIALTIVMVLFFASALIVFSRRPSFPRNQKIIFEIQIPNDQHHRIFAAQLDNRFAGNQQFLVDPGGVSADGSYTGVDCLSDNQSIIFWNGSLYRFDLTNGHTTQVLQGYGLHSQPVWSPDGTRIAYINVGQNEIFSTRADGTDTLRLTNTPVKKTSLAWSSDGTRIAYTYASRGGHRQPGIAIVTLGDGAESTIYEAPAEAKETTAIASVVWSPDGSHLAFTLADGKRTDIYTIQPDGSALTRLTRNRDQNVLPQWSPDSSMISFSALDSTRHYQIYIMDADGGNPYPLIIKPAQTFDYLNRCWLAGAA